ncbi:HotDog domain-containing protein [Mycena galericulata]|nr:HotDog domain-containing protein [Mycena galericulata]
MSSVSRMHTPLPLPAKRTPAPTPKSSPPHGHEHGPKPWIDPLLLPDDAPTAAALAARAIAGSAPAHIKQLACNTFFAYGVGADPTAFGYAVGRAVRWVEIDVVEDGLGEYGDAGGECEEGGREGNGRERTGRGKGKGKGKARMEARTVAEVVVTKEMLNGAGMLHGGCVTYLIDNCASTPLVVLGLAQGTNGVGVTQGMNVLFHAPAAVGAHLRIASTSISMGGRVMTARCEISDKSSGRVVASAFLNKMQPQPQAKL